MKKPVLKVTVRSQPTKAELVRVEVKEHADGKISEWYVFRYRFYYVLIEKLISVGSEYYNFEISFQDVIWHGTMEVAYNPSMPEFRRLCFKFLRNFYKEEYRVK